ncbi:nuclear transport factor 2 family protein [Streptomyces wuyuanensis]|uniref:nuclear transport factor 2 family protein n=1 Tax=Streptomyces wuyuanensis TaxID=1196353 RepID=UPI00341C8A38
MNTAKIARDWIDSYNSQDTERYHALYADDVDVASNRFGVRIHGKEANRELMDTYFAALPDGQMTAKSVIASERLVAMELEFNGTVALGYDGLPGLPHPGDRFSVDLCIVLELFDGLICRERDYSD